MEVAYEALGNLSLSLNPDQRDDGTPGDVQACTVKYSEEVWPGVNQRGKPPSLPTPSWLSDALLPRGCFDTHTYIRLYDSSQHALFRRGRANEI